MLDTDTEACGKHGPVGKTVFNVLLEKRTDQKTPDRSAFLLCKDLPSLEHVDIISFNVETVARSLGGSAGPSGTDSDQRKS